MRSIVAAALIAGVAAAPASAQQYQLQLHREVDRVAAALKDSGFAPAGPLTYGTLDQNSRDARPLELAAGARYIIAGVCDQDCTSLVLTLADPSGAAAGTGGGTASRPTIEVPAAAHGTYRLTVEMRGCRQSPCYWGAQLFRK